MSDKLKTKLARAELMLRVSKVKGVAPTAVEDIAERLLAHFAVDDDGELGIRRNSATPSWSTPESMVDDMRFIAPHLFGLGSANTQSGPSQAEVAAMSPEQKLSFANEQNRKGN